MTQYDKRDQQDRHTLVAAVLLAGTLGRHGISARPAERELIVADATELAAMLIQKIESIYE